MCIDFHRKIDDKLMIDEERKGTTQRKVAIYLNRVTILKPTTVSSVILDPQSELLQSETK